MDELELLAALGRDLAPHGIRGKDAARQRLEALIAAAKDGREPPVPAERDRARPRLSRSRLPNLPDAYRPHRDLPERDR